MKKIEQQSAPQQSTKYIHLNNTTARKIKPENIQREKRAVTSPSTMEWMGKKLLAAAATTTT